MTEPAPAGRTADAEGLSLRDCDLIMKGGISSGIVYPRAVSKLAKTYRLRRIGGASAGAIAAAFAAAAQYGGADGFDKLDKIPKGLGTGLAELFQPEAATRPAHSIVTAWLEPGWSIGQKVRASLSVIIRRSRWIFVLVALLLLVPGFAVAITGRGAPQDLGDWLGLALATMVWLPTALVVATMAAAVLFCRKTLRDLKDNGYGLCNGHAKDSTAKPGGSSSAAATQQPLTDWLSSEIDDLAQVLPDHGPLTIGDLWGAEAVKLQMAIAAKGDEQVEPEERIAAGKARLIDLEVMTTNLTLRRPYRFPFSQRIFYFCEDRMRDYFPAGVVDHLTGHSSQATDGIDSGEGGDEVPISMNCPCHGKAVWHLPAPWDIPVVLAARISLSFPGLISAVPLFCVDRSRGFGKRDLIEVWFSDGGISSNFPMHFFDTFWPTRPTFGIDLRPVHPDFPELVWRAKSVRSGRTPPSYQIESVPGFLMAIIRTMQNWVDTTQATMPGYSDRIAVIRQKPGEGGLNLKMTQEVIEDLAKRGAEAAATFDDFDFEQHRWIRYRIAMSELDECLTRMNTDYVDGYQQFIGDYAPRAEHYRIEPRGEVEITHGEGELTANLMLCAKAAAAAGHPAGAGSVPDPKPSIRLVPRQ